MEIVVNDTQILIDMHSCGLLDMIKKSNVITAIKMYHMF